MSTSIKVWGVKKQKNGSKWMGRGRKRKRARSWPVHSHSIFPLPIGIKKLVRKVSARSIRGGVGEKG